jgi:hypothetical protein
VARLGRLAKEFAAQTDHGCAAFIYLLFLTTPFFVPPPPFPYSLELLLALIFAWTEANAHFPHRRLSERRLFSDKHVVEAPVKAISVPLPKPLNCLWPIQQ